MAEKRIPPEMAELLLAWYDRCARVLPWRSEVSPYRTWVSEIMLQQTRVDTVLPYFERFMAELPTVADLAACPEEKLLKLWEGLGYYSRVRNLQKAARVVMEQHGGGLPGSFEELRKLPGVGDYTAGAIGSIAFGLPLPAVDGNVLRVISRLTCREDDILDPKVKKRTEGEILAVQPRERPGDFNQALMDLGATVCLPNGAPLCGRCPWESICEAHRQGVEETLPVKAAKRPRKVEERTVFVLTCGGKLALCRRPEKGLLAGLWELPAAPGKLKKDQARQALEEWGMPGAKPEKLPGDTHIFTHVEWRMVAWAAEAPEELPGFTWATAEALEREIMLPSAFSAWREAVFARLEKHPPED
mgnify:CR=1 FL=1